MTDDYEMRTARAERAGMPGLAAYLEARAELDRQNAEKPDEDPRRTLDDLTRSPRVAALRAAIPALESPGLREASESEEMSA